MVKIAIPATPEELQEMLADEKSAELAFTTKESTGEFINAYAAQLKRDDPDLEKQLADAEAKGQRKALEQMEISSKRLPMDPAATKRDKGGRHNPDAPGAVLDNKFRRFSEFLQAHDWQQKAVHGIDQRFLDDAYQRVLGESQLDQGGALVPEEFRAELMMQALEVAIVRPRAMVIPMTTLSMRVPVIRDATHASTVFGGVQAYWVPESGALTLSEPTFAQVKMEAKKLTGSTRVANELIRDSAISVEAILTQQFADALAFFEDDAFIQGVGGGQPLGLLNADALVSISKETGQAATTIVWENIVKMYSRMLPSSLGSAVWIANNDTFPQLATMALNVGTGGSAVWINNGVAGPPMSILGRPVLFTEKAKTLGTAGDIYFADLSYYMIADRQQLELASSEHTRFANDETYWRMIQRVDGRPRIDTALTPRQGSNTLSPFVDLAVRS